MVSDNMMTKREIKCPICDMVLEGDDIIKRCWRITFREFKKIEPILIKEVLRDKIINHLDDDHPLRDHIGWGELTKAEFRVSVFQALQLEEWR